MAAETRPRRVVTTIAGAQRRRTRATMRGNRAMIEVFTITIERQGKRREYEMRTMDPKLDPRNRDDQYAEGFVANVLLSGQEICRTSAWDTREEAVSEAVHYLLTETWEKA